MKTYVVWFALLILGGLGSFFIIDTVHRAQQRDARPDTITTTHSFVVGYEGDFDEISYSFISNPAVISLNVIANQPTVGIRDRATGAVGAIQFFYNGAVGFTSADELFYSLGYCATCTPSSKTLAVPFSSDVHIYANEREQWVIAHIQGDLGFVVAHISTNSTDVLFDVLQHMTVTTKKKIGYQPESIPVKVYFVKQSTNMSDCSKVAPITRYITKTPQVAGATLAQLISGPSREEKKLGYVSEIPSDSWVYSIAITNGFALVNFSKEIDVGGGSCHKTALRAQIEKTLLQFPTVKTVEIQVEGNSATALQP